MDHIKAVEEFFHVIAPQARDLVTNSGQTVLLAEQKTAADYSTEVDIAAENLIVAEINRRFPGDAILAEEGHSATMIPDGRIWIIDPICGTSNLGKGLKNFCTNIALADNRQVIAACVVDHTTGDYIWSVGQEKIFVNERAYIKPAYNLGIKVDIDFGATKSVDINLIEKHNRCLLKLIRDTDYDVVSLNSSIGCAYTALNKLDGYLCIYNHPWDICAGSFLVQQSGGIVTDLEGNPWRIDSVGAIAGASPEVHDKLLQLFSSN